MFRVTFLEVLFYLLSCGTLSYESNVDLSFGDTKYNIKLLNHPTVELTGTTLQVYSKYGQPFSCKLPDISENDSSKNETISNLIVLYSLKDLSSRCISMVTGWWTYEICYGTNITQYHINEIDPRTRSSKKVLGYYSSETDWEYDAENLQKQTYHSQNYTGGDICDITSKPRVAEVRFLCLRGESVRMLSVEEVETCVYLIHVHVPSFCHYERFRVDKNSVLEEILCLPIVSPSEMALFQMNDRYIRPSDGHVTIVDEMQRKSDNRVRTLWYTHKRIVSRRRNLERRRVKQLTRHLFRVLFHKVTLQQTREFSHAAIASYFTEMSSGAPVPLAYWLLHYQLQRLVDEVYDLAGVVQNLKALTPSQLVHLKAFVNLMKRLVREVDGVVQHASGYKSESTMPIANLLETITIFKAISRRFMSSNDVDELKTYAGDIERVQRAFTASTGPPGNQKPATVFVSPDSTESLRMLKHLLQLHLAELELAIKKAEQDSLVNNVTVQLENSVTNMFSDLKNRVLIFLQPARSSPNPRNVNNPYAYRKPAEAAEATPKTEPTPPLQPLKKTSESLPDEEEEVDDPLSDGAQPISQQIVSRLIHKAFRKVLPGVSVTQTASSKLGGMEIVYIYSSEEKGKEDRRSSRQESAYKFSVTKQKRRQKETAAKP